MICGSGSNPESENTDHFKFFDSPLQHKLLTAWRVLREVFRCVRSWELIRVISDVCVFGTFSSGLRQSVKILCSYFRVECRRCASQRPSNIAGFGALEHNQAKVSKFPGLHLQRLFGNVSSSYLLRSFVYMFEASELIRTETRRL